MSLLTFNRSASSTGVRDMVDMGLIIFKNALQSILRLLTSKSQVKAFGNKSYFENETSIVTQA